MEKKTIIQLLNNHGYNPKDINNESLINEIDSILENPHLSIEICNKGQVWMDKKTKFRYNLKLILYTKPKGWIIDEKKFVYMGNPIELSFIHKMLNEFIKGENKKFGGNEYSKKSFDDNNVNDDDSFSEKNIMRDLERGEGYKHGLD
jgi:hypothetical protein